MSWSVRHEGSPAVIEGLTTEQVAQGLGEGSWEPTDEVRGPDEPAWQALENHPQFADVALELEPPPRREEDDETRLDMNPLIDVCLVLLIFFMLTASYAALTKYLESPALNPKSINDVPKLTQKQVEEMAVKVTARRNGTDTVIQVEDKPVELKELAKRLKELFRANAKKKKVWLELDDKVPYGTYISIIDQAAEAGAAVLLQVPGKANERKPKSKS